MAKRKQSGRKKAKPAKTASPPRRSPVRGKQLGLPLGTESEWPKVKAGKRGIVRGKPETFPPGTAMDVRGYPAYSLVLRTVHPKAASAIAKEMQAADDARQRREAAESQAKLIELDQPLGGDRLDVSWAKGLLNHLSADMRREIEGHVKKLTFEQVGWMDGSDDYWQEYGKVNAIIAMGIEFGFAMALARFREPLTKHAPEASKLIRRLDENRKLGTEATKAKPIKARDKLRDLMSAAQGEGREVTINEVMAALKCSRTTAWRRMTEIELQPREQPRGQLAVTPMRQPFRGCRFLFHHPKNVA